jgi:cation diffusion facilitator family transporter
MSAPSQEQEYGRRVRRVLLITLLLNLSVVVAKLAAGIAARSLSVISDGLHSSVDGLNNIAGLIIVRIATSAPDDEHHYGHHKYENLGAFVIAGLLLITSFEVASGAVKRILGWVTSDLEVTGATFAAVIASVGVNLFVWWYERAQGRSLGSSILLADSNHTLSDIFVSLSILAGLLLFRYGIANLDGILALVVSLVIAYAAYRILSTTIPVLVDSSPFPRAYIAEIVRSTPGVESVHDIMSRGISGKAFITMHLAVTPMNTSDAHAVTEEVERRLEEKLGKCHVTIHIEPSDYQ